MKIKSQKNSNLLSKDYLKFDDLVLRTITEIVFFTSIIMEIISERFRSRRNFFNIYNLVYFIMFIVALAVYVMQRLNFSLPSLVNNYLNDFLCLPLLLRFISNFIRRIKNDALFRLPIIFVIIVASYYSFYFEYYLPPFNPRYTADWIDAFLYFFGGFTFLLIEKFRYRIDELFSKK